MTDDHFKLLYREHNRCAGELTEKKKNTGSAKQKRIVGPGDKVYTCDITEE